MADAGRDNNREATALAIDGDGTIKRLLVDGTTGRLLIECYLLPEASRTINTQKFDNNYESVSLGYDGTDPQPLLIDNNNGYLLIELNIE